MDFPGPAYRVVTPQLVLRCYSPADAEMMQNAIRESVEHLLPWMPWAAAEPEPLQAKIERLRQMRARFDLGQDYVYGIFNPQENRLLGGTGLHTRVGSEALEIGYWIHADHVHKGYATEASAALTKVGFEVMHVKRMEIHCAVDNVASAAVPRKLGYTLEGTRRKLSFSHGNSSDQLIWTMFEEEYLNSPARQLEIAAYDAAGRRII